MASSPKAPSAVDTTGAAQASALSNLNFANITTAANRVNQVNQNGTVRWTSEDVFDEGAYSRAVRDWGNADPKTRGNAPTKNEFMSKTWTQTESPNATLRKTAADQQAAGEFLASAARDKANQARNSLKTTFTAPQLSNYMKNVPGLDTSKINQVKSYDSNAKLSTDLAGGLDRLNVADSQKVGAFQSNGTNLDTDFSNNAKTAGTIKDFAKQAAAFKSNAKVDTSVNDNLKNVGSVQNVGTNVSAFKSNANLDTNISDNMKNVGNVESYNKMNADFASKAKLNTDVNGAFAGVRALNQNGAGTVGDFQYSGPGVQTKLNSNAKVDTNLNDNLSRNGVSMKQAQFDDGGDRVRTNAPRFDERTADRYAKAAYESQMAFQRGDMERDIQRSQNKLALQGLGVDSEAARASMGEIYDSQAKARNQLSNQALLTGADIARQNYASQLAGFAAGNDAEAQRFAQEQSAFGMNQAANAQAFSQNQAAFQAQNQANLSQFGMDQARAEFANQAQNQKFAQAADAYKNTLAGRQTNQQIIDSTNQARQAAFGQAAQKFDLSNQAQKDQFALDTTTFNNRIAANAANADLVAQRNAAQNQRYSQSAQNFQLQNAANQAQFGLDDARYQNVLDAQRQQADLVAMNNANQNQRFNQATNAFQLNNAAAAQQFGQDDSAYQNQLAQLQANLGVNQANNQNQQARYNQALQSFNASNEAKNAMFAQNVQRFDQNVNRATTNAQLQAMDNQAALQQQAWKQNNLNFTNTARLQQEDINQRDFQNQLQAQAANMNLRNANNDIRSQALNEQYQRYGADLSAAETNRYRALNEYQSLLNGTTPVPSAQQYQAYSQQGQVGGVDYLGAANANNQQAMARYNAGVASANATNSALSQAATMAAMFAFAPSDERLKKNVQKIGETDSGRDLYSWDWNDTAKKKLGLTGSESGVIAQENRDISKKMPNGFLAVDYSKINTKKK